MHESTASIRGVDLRRDAARAAAQLCISLCEKTLPSAWSPSGRGWQEHWATANYAGIYASCEGILILADYAKQEGNAQELIRNVFLNHLVPAFNPALPAQDEIQYRQRIECSTTTNKICKFVQASSAVSIADLEPLPGYVDLLLALGEQHDGFWPAIVDEDDASPASTCEASVLVASLKDERSKSLTTRAIEALQALLVRDLPDQSWKIVFAWALAEIAERTRSRELGHSSNLISALSMIPPEDSYVQEYFYNKSLHHGDYYHFNTSLLGATAIFDLISLGVLDKYYMSIALPILRRVCTRILATGYYTSRETRFWEQHQAFCLMRRFALACDYIKFMEEIEFMYVNPQHFRQTQFQVDSRLVAVLMPFRPDWSDDVFKAFERAATANSLRIWRSDLVHKDDQIMQTVWEHINQAKFVVADCTGQNPNVFYELGIAHTIGKPVFICAQRRKDIPFDLASIRSYEYKSPIPKNLEGLQSKLDLFFRDYREEQK